jgi:hypothetical protein
MSGSHEIWRSHLLTRNPHVDFDQSADGQRRHRHSGSGGEGRTEVLCIYAIHAGEVIHVGEKYTNSQSVVECSIAFA